MSTEDQKQDKIEELKKAIFESPVPQFSTIISDDPDLVNYDFKNKELLVIINGVTHKIQNVDQEQFYKYSDFLYSRGKFILR